MIEYLKAEHITTVARVPGTVQHVAGYTFGSTTCTCVPRSKNCFGLSCLFKDHRPIT
jgi:hypothetical protein